MESLADLDRGLSGGRDSSASPRRVAAPPQLAPVSPRPVGPPTLPPAPPRRASVARRQAPLAVFETDLAPAPEAPAPREVQSSASAVRPLLELFPPPPPPSRERTAHPVAALAGPPRIARRRAAVARIEPPPAPASYETFYGLTEPPFGATTDIKFLYHATAYDIAADGLLGALASRDRLIVLSGRPGIGKTFLCHTVIDQLDRHTMTSFIADPVLGIDDVLKTILVDFGVVSRHDMARARLGATSRPELLSTLGGFLDSLDVLKASAVIVIDRSQALGIDGLEQVGLLAQSAASTHLQIVLVGNEELMSLLKRRDLRRLAAQVTTRIALGPLAPDEVSGYIMHRLGVAGANTRVDFDPAAVARIAEISGGVPHVVNQLAEESMRAGYEASASLIERSMVNHAAARLELAVPSHRSSIAETAVLVLVLLVMTAVGAGTATWVFSANVEQALAAWSRPPAAPAAPARDRLTPLVPIPPPEPAPLPPEDETP